MARAIAFCEIPIGSRYSLRRISPGVIGFFIFITCNVTGVLSMVVEDLYFAWAVLGPAKNDSPLLIDSYGIVTGERTFQCFQPVSGRDGQILDSFRMVHLY